MNKITLMIAANFILSAHVMPVAANDTLSQVRYGLESVDNIDIFYREAGNPKNPTLVLLHGFPSSSYQYRELLSSLGDDFYLLAPDYPGYGHSEKPDSSEYRYTFNNVAQTMEKFLDQRKVDDYVLMIHDFGAPIGLRIAAKNPKDVAGFIVMNGNAYDEGLSDIIKGSLKSERSSDDEKKKVKGLMSLNGIKWQYTAGTRSPESLSPDSWTLDHAIMNQTGVTELNLDMIYDYKSNVELYPKWQQYLRSTQPPMLIVWGKGDPIFTEAGAEAYKRDVENIDYNILDTGHFPLEEDSAVIIEKIQRFMEERIN
ncbi:alpha/beta fold hydrolase [Vibrio sp. Vb339]|uniref:alpha/beta fold hydrolase n=1 Tax=Vibrio sp. Vb339 TaxID=1192013 RepID=UPI001C12EAF8|nr:alpha/beta hydrolase [Vibrio sp. Vb339]